MPHPVVYAVITFATEHTRCTAVSEGPFCTGLIVGFGVGFGCFTGFLFAKCRVGCKWQDTLRDLVIIAVEVRYKGGIVGEVVFGQWRLREALGVTVS